jgi:hypothetical protein
VIRDSFDNTDDFLEYENQAAEEGEFMQIVVGDHPPM